MMGRHCAHKMSMSEESRRFQDDASCLSNGKGLSD